MTAEECKHLDFVARVDVHRLYEFDYTSERIVDPATLPMPDGYLAEVKVECVQCGVPLVFFGAGLAMGLTRDRPAISPDGTELRCPVRPQTSDPHQGLGLAGLEARIREGQPHGLN